MSRITELEEKAKELMKEIETLKQEKIEEFEYPFEEDEPYWAVKDEGYVQWLKWDNECYDKPRYEQGHIFKTEQEAIRERDKRALLTRFRQFRDKCNRDWKPTINEKNIIYFLILKNINLKLIGFVKLEYLNRWVSSKTKKIVTVLSNYSGMKLRDCIWSGRND